MSKPKMTQQSAIRLSSASSRAGWIRFIATDDAAGDLSLYGIVSSEGGYSYRLAVDPRYDFNDVVNYIKNYK